MGSIADLFRRDPHYAEHQGKRLHRIVLTREASESLTEFARRHGIRVSVLGTENAMDVTDARERINHKQENPASIPEKAAIALSPRAVPVGAAPSGARDLVKTSRPRSRTESGRSSGSA
jgi:hypothetical protein